MGGPVSRQSKGALDNRKCNMMGKSQLRTVHPGTPKIYLVNSNTHVGRLVSTGKKPQTIEGLVYLLKSNYSHGRLAMK